MGALLVFNFHPAFYPPKSGGEQRLYYIYRHLSETNKVTLITFTYPSADGKIETVRHSDNFLEIRIPKTGISRVLHAAIDRLSDIKECSAVVTSIESRFNSGFKRIAREEIGKADTVIFSSPFLFTLPNRWLKGKRVIHESYNVEYDLMRPAFNGSAIGKVLLKYVFGIEKASVRRSDLVFAVSEGDRSKFYHLYGIDQDRIKVSPNGVNPGDYTSISRSDPNAQEYIYTSIFTGSYHAPNIEAAQQILDIARQMPDVRFIIAGSVSRHFSSLRHMLTGEMMEGFPGSLVSPGSGFYNTEYWGDIPTAWTSSRFDISIVGPVFSLQIKLYSDSINEIHISGTGISSSYPLAKGWNIVDIPNIPPGCRSIAFEMDKAFKDRGRELGVAIQEICYCRQGNRLQKVDLCSSPDVFSIADSVNVLFVNNLSDNLKLMLYSASNISLNPMLSGSGTNIKMLDYMAAGLPVITTPIGARGLKIENGINVMICDIAEFPDRIRLLQNNPGLYKTLKAEGLKIVREKYSWDKIAKDMDRYINGGRVKR